MLLYTLRFELIDLIRLFTITRTTCILREVAELVGVSVKDKQTWPPFQWSSGRMGMDS